MTIRIPTVILCLTLTVTAAPGAQGNRAEVGVVATVNGEKLYFEDVERQLRELHAGRGETSRAAFDLDRLMARVVNDALIAQEARALGMHEEKPIPQRLRERREAMARDRLEKEEIRERVELSEDEIRQEFEDTYRSVSFRILTTSDKNDAELLRRRLDEGQDLASLATEPSANGQPHRYESFDSVHRVDIPSDIGEVLLGLESGQIGGPFSTNLGWSIVHLESFTEANSEEFARYEARIRERARFRKADARRKELAAELRKAFDVTIDQQAADIECESPEGGRLVPIIEQPDAIVVRAGGRSITAQDFGQALRQRWETVTNREAALASRSIILERLIDRELLIAEALRRGYGKTPEVERELHSYLTDLLVPRFLNEVLAPTVEISEEEKTAYYTEHREEFRRLPRLKLGQVTVEDSALAERVAELLLNKADLAWVAKEYSIDGFKHKGGDVGWVVPSVELGEFQEMLVEAEPGAVLGPFPQAEGRFVVLRLDAKEDQGYYTPAEVSGNLRSAVFALKFRQRLDEFFSKLRERSEIAIHQEILDGMRITGTDVSGGAHSVGEANGHADG
jgi:parvulin-like peptidyl-prolyl isomerase